MHEKLWRHQPCEQIESQSTSPHQYDYILFAYELHVIYILFAYEVHVIYTLFAYELHVIYTLFAYDLHMIHI